MTEAIPDLVSTPEAAEIMGVPEPELTRLVKVLELKAARPGSKTEPRYWDRQTIEALNQGPEGAEIREAVARKEEIKKIMSRLSGEYPEWKHALRPAADAMFNFNRFAKWSSTSQLRRRELYELKDQLIERLYNNGYCRELLVHATEAEEEDCEKCQGTGTDWKSQPCTECEGKGAITLGAPQEHLAFCFHIDGGWYNWHTPRKGIQWHYELMESTAESPEPRDWKPKGEEKPIAIEPEAFLHAEALIRFVLHGFREEDKAKKQAEKEKRREQMRREGLARQAELRRQRAEEEGSDPQS